MHIYLVLPHTALPQALQDPAAQQTAAGASSKVRLSCRAFMLQLSLQGKAWPP